MFWNSLLGSAWAFARYQNLNVEIQRSCKETDIEKTQSARHACMHACIHTYRHTYIHIYILRVDEVRAESVVTNVRWMHMDAAFFLHRLLPFRFWIIKMELHSLQNECVGACRKVIDELDKEKADKTDHFVAGSHQRGTQLCFASNSEPCRAGFWDFNRSIPIPASCQHI